MTRTERLIRSIIGDSRCGLRPIVCASDLIAMLILNRHISLEDIQAERVYAHTARQTGLSPGAAAMRVQRFCRLCWACMEEQGLIFPYIGRIPPKRPKPCFLIGYLAFYACYHISYFEAIDCDRTLLFPPDTEGEKSEYLTARSHPLPVLRTKQLGGCEFPVCPGCGCTLEREYQSYCDRCGCKLNWKNVPRIPPNKNP